MLEDPGDPQPLAMVLNVPSGPKRYEDSKGICIVPIEAGPDDHFIRINDFSALRVQNNWPCENWFQCQGCQRFFVENTYFTNEFLHLRRHMYVTPLGRPYCHDCGTEMNRLVESYVDTEEKRPPIEIEVPVMFMTASESDYKPDIRKRLMQWPRKVPLLGIQGIPGSGKSRATWALAKRMAYDGRRVWHDTAPSLKGRWLSLASSDQKKRLELETMLQMTPWLILDDISGIKATPGWQEFFHQLLEKRTIAQRPTVITMAGGGEEIQEAYGSQIRSRMNLFQWIALPEKDWRMAKIAPEDKKPTTLFDAVNEPKKLPEPPTDNTITKGPKVGG